MTDSPPVADDTAAPVAEDPKPAEPTAEPAESAPAKPASMLEAVTAAIKPKEVSPTSEPADAAKAEGEPPPDDKKDDEDDELSEDEKSKLSARTTQRIKKLDKAVKAAQAEIGTLRPKAEEYEKIENFVRESGLTNDAVAGTLQIAALIRQNPREALNRLTPIVQQLQSMVGETLPPELAQRVQQGFLTEQDARAIARSSAEAAINARRAQEAQERLQFETAARDQRQVVDSTINSVETWEANKAKTDPDWKHKSDEIAEAVETAILKKSHELGRAWFPTQQEAIELSEQALKKVNERFKRFAPRPTAINPAASGGASARSNTAPKSMLDVVRQSVGA
jgi:hypothetical protein